MREAVQIRAESEERMKQAEALEAERMVQVQKETDEKIVEAQKTAEKQIEKLKEIAEAGSVHADRTLKQRLMAIGLSPEGPATDK